MRIELTLNSPTDTEQLGRAIGAKLNPGDVILLDGPLGGGKTTLVRAIADGLGIEPGVVSSPTFVIINEYPNAVGPDLVHVDAYRLDEHIDLDELGWDRVFDGSTIIVIEWAERLGGQIASMAISARLRLTPTGDSSRLLEGEVPDSWVSIIEPPAASARAPTTCPITGVRVEPDNPHYPFADDRSKLADLNRWFTGRYTVSRPVEEDDLTQFGG